MIRAGLTTAQYWVQIRRYSATCPRRHDSFLGILIGSYSSSIPLSRHWPCPFNDDVAAAANLINNICDLMIIGLFHPNSSIHWTTLYSLPLFIVTVYLRDCHLLARLLILVLIVDCLSFWACIHTLDSVVSLITNESIRLNHVIMAAAANLMNLCLIQMAFPLYKLLMVGNEAVSLLTDAMMIFYEEWRNQ